MIYVMLGTQDKSFVRLLKEIDKLCVKGVLQDKIIVQSGYTKYESKYLQLIDYVDLEHFNEYIKQADFVITHGGVGSILDSVKLGKKVIAVPRLAKYNEHQNDHQLQVISDFSKKGYIIGCKKVGDLEEAINELKTFKPKKYKSNNSDFVKMIDSYLEGV